MDLVEQLAQYKIASLPAKLEARLRSHPRCAVSRYLLGCHCFDHGRIATGVQHFMIAHHAEPQLESAAFLAFAGLSAATRPQDALLSVLLDTWEEYRRPEFDRCPKECRLLDAFAESDPGLGNASPLAARLWRLPVHKLHRQIRTAIRSADEVAYPLLLFPA